MTKIEAVIRPEKLEEVKLALDEIGVTGITVTEVRGAGQQRGYVHRYRGAEYRITLLEKIKLEMVVPDGLAEEAVDTIIVAGRTGEVGDGKVFLMPVDNAIRVRTAEQGEAAIR
jgi:nitrogen regulatory protein P-II 1